VDSVAHRLEGEVDPNLTLWTQPVHGKKGERGGNGEGRDDPREIKIAPKREPGGGKGKNQLTITSGNIGLQKTRHLSNRMIKRKKEGGYKFGDSEAHSTEKIRPFQSRWLRGYCGVMAI